MRGRILLPLITRTAGVSKRRAICGIGLFVAIPLGVFGYQAQDAWRATTGDFGSRQTKASTGTTRYGTEDFASFNRWKRGVEQALKDEEAKDQARRHDAAKATESVDAIMTANVARQEAAPTTRDLGIAREAAKQREETLSANNEDEATSGAEAASPPHSTPDTIGTTDAQRANTTRQGPSWTEGQETNLTNVPGPINVAQAAASQGLHEAIPWRHTHRQGWGRRYGMGSRLGWGYHRLIGVARAFPYVLSVR
jgi:hypothetical protein